MTCVVKLGIYFIEGSVQVYSVAGGVQVYYIQWIHYIRIHFSGIYSSVRLLAIALIAILLY